MKTRKIEFPDWALKHKTKGTELRCISGNYYLYNVSSKYDKELKRAKKITGTILGKITQKDGLILSKRSKKTNTPLDAVPIYCREYGLSRYMFNSFSFIKDTLQESFPDYWQIILALTYCRLGWQAPLKNVPYLIEQSALKEYASIGQLNDKSVRQILSFLGKNRDLLRAYMCKFVQEGAYNLIDATEFFSKSEKLSLAEKGYNKDMVFDRQISLLYIYSTNDQMPIFYRMLAGNLREVKTMKLTIMESNIKNAVIIADKGFYSKANVDELKSNELNFIIPLKRDNKAIDYNFLTDIESSKNYFKYKDKYIYYTIRKEEADTCILYLDGRLKEEEKTDYLNRIQRLPEKYNHDNFSKKLPAMGTIALFTNLEDPNPEDLYFTYKSRANIEQMFDNLKNILAADVSYMQDNDMIQGWMFINHIALQCCHLLYKKLKEEKLLGTLSVQDALFFLKELRQVRINEEWKTTEVTKKAAKVLAKFGVHIT